MHSHRRGVGGGSRDRCCTTSSQHGGADVVAHVGCLIDERVYVCHWSTYSMATSASAAHRGRVAGAIGDAGTAAGRSLVAYRRREGTETSTNRILHTNHPTDIGTKSAGSWRTWARGSTASASRGPSGWRTIVDDLRTLGQTADSVVPAIQPRHPSPSCLATSSSAIDLKFRDPPNSGRGAPLAAERGAWPSTPSTFNWAPGLASLAWAGLAGRRRRSALRA